MMLNRLVFFLGLFSSIYSYGAFEDHLKKVEGKSTIHKMDHIDFIYMINLDQRPEKFELSKSSLEPYGIYPCRFSAVNGWQLSIAAINEIGVKYQPGMTPLLGTTYPLECSERTPSHEFMTEYGKTYFCHCMGAGAMGCALSHISILQDAYDSGYETIWVMEDDIEVIRDPNCIPGLIDELDALVGKENWDVLFTGFDYRTGPDKYLPASGAAKRPDMDCSPTARYSDQYTKSIKVSENFTTVGARFGTTSMIIRRSGIVKLLQFAKERKIYLPYDLENYLVPGIRRYAFTFDVVTNLLESISDISGANYLKEGE